MSAYTQASKDVFEVFRQTTPLVEGVSIDEAFLDVGGLRRVSGPPVDIAVRLRREVLEQGRAADHRRGGRHEIPREGGQRGRQTRWAAGGSDRDRAGVPASAAGATALGRRAGQHREAARGRASTPSARSPGWVRPAWSRSSARAFGRHLHALAHNRDPRSVTGGAATAVDRFATRPGPVPAPARRHRRRGGRAGRPGDRRMRDAERTGRTVMLRLRFDDYTRVTRSHTLIRPTAATGADPGHRPRAGRRRHAADPRARADAGRHRGRQSRRPRVGPAGAAVRGIRGGRAGHGDGRDPRPVRLRGAHPGRADGSATRGWRCRCCRTDLPCRSVPSALSVLAWEGAGHGHTQELES